MIRIDSRESGVYCIRCTINNFTYYGSCGHKKGIGNRIYQHLYHLERGTHSSYLLQRDFKRYGEEAFEVVIVHLCPPDECLSAEQLYIDMFGIGEDFQSYNLCPAAHNCLGRKTSEKTRALISKANKGKIKGIKRSAETRLRMSQAWKGKKKSAQQLEKITAARSFTYVLIDPFGQSQVVKNLRKFCRESGLHQGALAAVARGDAPHHKRWVAVKIETESLEGIGNAQAEALERWNAVACKTPIWILSGPIGGEIRARVLSEICDALGLHAGCMTKVASGEREHHKSWTCRKIFLDEQINSQLTS